MENLWIFLIMNHILILSEFYFLNSNSLNLYYTDKVKDSFYEYFMSIDLSDTTIKQLPLSKGAPKWRIINKEENPKCETFQEGIIFTTLKIETLS